MENTRFRIAIKPVVRESRDARAIRKAFALGCGGVIVEGNVPAALTNKLLEISPSTIIPSAVDSARNAGLGEWLDQQREWLGSSKLIKTYEGRIEDVTPETYPMSLKLWHGDKISVPWHIDVGNRYGFYDAHIHICGEGMIVASPKKTLSPLFEWAHEDRSSPKLTAKGYQELSDKGFEEIALKPGEILLFENHCLHQSSPDLEDRLKLRAGIY